MKLIIKGQINESYILLLQISRTVVLSSGINHSFIGLRIELIIFKNIIKYMPFWSGGNFLNYPLTNIGSVTAEKLLTY